MTRPITTASFSQPMVVQGHRPHPRRIHRADCTHCVPPTVLVKATPQEVRTVQVCDSCARREAKERAE